ncbi:hypothetical protein B0H16DRAFT_315359 [Mycena metata]|uniref:Uncharacterized protein n=1 Tax=Mycena metata TaxID=1033252 RepID=A0AAD7JP87_9AGAR|nr:hypothetical protein B0H16DRAFT_315359 [Mycena metata]
MSSPSSSSRTNICRRQPRGHELAPKPRFTIVYRLSMSGLLLVLPPLVLSSRFVSFILVATATRVKLATGIVKYSLRRVKQRTSAHPLLRRPYLSKREHSDALIRPFLCKVILLESRWPAAASGKGRLRYPRPPATAHDRVYQARKNIPIRKSHPNPAILYIFFALSLTSASHHGRSLL